MRRRSEPIRAPEATVELIRTVAAQIEPEDPGLREWFSRYAAQHGNRLAADLEIVRREAPADANVLEFGAVPLLMTTALARSGYSVSGVDLAPERFARAIEELGLDVRACDIEQESTPFEDARFDLVLFNELFEHLRINPIFTLREVHRVLKPEGVLLLSTPNLRSLRGVRNLLFHGLGHASSGGVYEQYGKLETLGHMGHVREYTVREVTEFLGRIGFKTDTVIFRGGHGRGLVGWAERLAPGWRPFFMVVARKDRTPRP